MHSNTSRFALTLLLALFVAGCIGIVPWQGIGASWRECDTQSMAQSLAFEEFDVLRPRVRWRGDGDGGVEAEMPIYQATIAVVLRLVGNAEWPGRAISLLATLLGAAAWFGLLRRSLGSTQAAILGTAALLAAGSIVLTSCRVMPDAFSMAMCLVGWALLARAAEAPRLDSTTMIAATICTSIGCLAKSTSLQILAMQAGWLLTVAPSRLRHWQIWLHFTTPAAVTFAWMLHAAAIGEETGLTFGVLSAGDSKVPDMEHLCSPGLYVAVARTSLVYGILPAGVVALGLLTWKGKVRRQDLAILAPIALALVFTMRYSASENMGPHYHLGAAAAGSWLVARAAMETHRWPRMLLAVLILASTILSFSHERTARHAAGNAAILTVATAVRESTSPADLIVVRSPKPRIDTYWNRRNNFEDPVLLYHAQRFGWVVPAEDFGVDNLAGLQRRGARMCVDLLPDRTQAASSADKKPHYPCVFDHAAGRVYSMEK